MNWTIFSGNKIEMEEQVRQDECEEDAAGVELEEEDEEEQEEAVQDLAGVKVKLVDGQNECSKWLIVDDVHICHKMREYSNETNKWRYAAYYILQLQIPFFLST